MIIGRDFVWLHFPKCAGSELEGVVRSLTGKLHLDLQLDQINGADAHWHDTIRKREQRDSSFRLANRAVLCNIRRLPYWILSRVHFEKLRSPELIVTREMLLDGRFVEVTGHVNSADRSLSLYNSPEVTEWLRTETLEDDFKLVFGRYLDLSHIDVHSAFCFRNKSKLLYIQDLAFWFSKGELARLYESCPKWADIERRVYGDILTL